MTRQLGKLLFPHLAHDQRQKKMNLLLLTVFSTLAISALVALLIYLLNGH